MKLHACKVSQLKILRMIKLKKRLQGLDIRKPCLIWGNRFGEGSCIKRQDHSRLRGAKMQIYNRQYFNKLNNTSCTFKLIILYNFILLNIVIYFGSKALFVCNCILVFQ